MWLLRYHDRVVMYRLHLLCLARLVLRICPEEANPASLRSRDTCSVSCSGRLARIRAECMPRRIVMLTGTCTLGKQPLLAKVEMPFQCFTSASALNLILKPVNEMKKNKRTWLRKGKFHLCCTGSTRGSAPDLFMLKASV